MEGGRRKVGEGTGGEQGGETVWYVNKIKKKQTKQNRKRNHKPGTSLCSYYLKSTQLMSNFKTF